MKKEVNKLNECGVIKDKFYVNDTIINYCKKEYK